MTHAPKTRRSLPMALLRARESIMDNFRPMLARCEVTEQQWRVLRVLVEAGEMDATELAGRAAILAPSLTRIIKNLEQRKLVRRAKSKDDARRVILVITPGGQKLVVDALPETSSIHALIEKNLGKQKLATLLDALEEITDLKLK